MTKEFGTGDSPPLFVVCKTLNLHLSCFSILSKTGGQVESKMWLKMYSTFRPDFRQICEYIFVTKLQDCRLFMFYFSFLSFKLNCVHELFIFTVMFTVKCRINVLDVPAVSIKGLGIGKVNILSL